ncbi:MAG: S41 family peptidase [SAR202 cluster bacterium]|nr:S41 family peptidase [SAR202 cluster bacterium]
MAQLKHLKIYLATLVVLLAIAAAACGGDDGDAAESSDTTSAPAATPTSPESPVFPEVVQTEKEVERRDPVPEDLSIIWETWSFLLGDYVDTSALDPEAFSEEAVRGMLTVLGDRQTAYVSPEVVTGSFSDIFRGNFEGIGAHVNLNRAGRLIIVSPIEGGPAEAAGIRPGDIILEVDGEVIEGLSLLEAVARIRGPKGTMVQLLVKHLGALDPVLIPVERNVIPLVSVVLRSQPGDKFAHIRLTQFFPNSPEALKEMLQQVIDDGAEGLILDIRDNDGGTLNAVVEIASMFLDSEEQDLVLYVQKGDGSRTNWKIRDVGIAKSMPMVILVNERSASSSEVLAGALQDYKRATVIGTTTFGKGSVNIMRPLSNGGGLYITIAHWYTPFGRIIQGEGLTPDIEVTDRDRQEADIQQLRAAIEELERKTASGS